MRDLFAAVGVAFVLNLATPAAEPVSLSSLLDEMTDPRAVSRLPDPPYASLQASSYNRASVHRDQPGWFADQDGLGFIRTEEREGRTEWVILEHEGPGCLTKMWTPFFYFGFNERTGPAVRIYVDGQSDPVLDESFILLLTGKGSVKPPFAAETARAGNLYLPIPFAKRCKVTLTQKPFYHLINYRAYPAGTPVQTFRRQDLSTAADLLTAKGALLLGAAPENAAEPVSVTKTLKTGESVCIAMPRGPAEVMWFRLRLAPDATNDNTHLRSTVLEVVADGSNAVWCPAGDFFSCADSIHPFHTWQRTVESNGTMTCRWPMPYRDALSFGLRNFGSNAVTAELTYATAKREWDERSMYFHAAWRPDEILPGTPFCDWTFVDIRGHGVFVGDAWTVLNPTQGWWGEGDEKIYVDGAWERGFPTHFGTGTEDYYGWAGGVVPTRADEFSHPFLANVRVGGEGGRTRGFNICTRTRSLDAIPFDERLCFDMEISPGTGQRRPTDFMGYSAVAFWYARPGAIDNRGPQVDAAKRSIMNLADLASRAPVAKKIAPRADVEFELLKPTAKSDGLGGGAQRPAESFKPEQWSGDSHYFIPSKRLGDVVEFTVSEQFAPQRLLLGVTTSYDFGIARISVNGRPVADRVDLFSETPAVRELDLGRCEPVDNRFVIRCELLEPNPRSRGAKTFMGLDALRLVP